MQVARIIAGECQVVFTTSHAHYAVNAFDSGARDYLLKPVERDRLQKAIHRLQRYLAVASSTGMPTDHIRKKAMQDDASNGQRNYLRWLCIQNGLRSKLVSVEEIYYFRADHKYTAVILQQDDALISKSIKSLVDELDPDRFWRIHRSTIVNVDQIETVTRSKTGRGVVRLKDRSEALTVSRPYLHLFKHM
jgi:DNA-binding LytR/AlgR family response regulator